MDQIKNTCRADLLAQTVDILNQYSDFSSEYKVSFSLTEPGEEGLPRIAAMVERTDGKTFAENASPLDKKLDLLKEQTAVVRPFFFPMCRAEWDNSDVNDFAKVDFDYAAIIGYGKNPDGTYFIKALYFPSTDAFLYSRSPAEDGVWRKIPLPMYYVYQLSLEPRKKFAKFLYLAERMVEALEYQVDKTGWFHSNQP